MPFGRKFGVMLDDGPSHDANAPAPSPFPPEWRDYGLWKIESTAAGRATVGMFHCRRFAAVAPWRKLYLYWSAPRSSADSGSVRRTITATSANAGQTPSASPTRPYSTGATAPDPMVPV